MYVAGVNMNMKKKSFFLDYFYAGKKRRVKGEGGRGNNNWL